MNNMQLHFLVTSEQRASGAIFFNNMNENILAFVYPNDSKRLFHTFFCPPLRIVALSADGEVLFDQVVQPWKFVKLPACRYVIETGPKVDYHPYRGGDKSPISALGSDCFSNFRVMEFTWFHWVLAGFGWC